MMAAVTGVTIGEELTNLRMRHPGCHAVVFADLSTGMVLASSTAERTTQEKLDALCEQARDYLFGNKTFSLPGSGGAESEIGPDSAWIAGPGGLRCFLLAPPPATEALCLVISDANTLEPVSGAARDVLIRITAEA